MKNNLKSIVLGSVLSLTLLTSCVSTKNYNFPVDYKSKTQVNANSYVGFTEDEICQIDESVNLVDSRIKIPHKLAFIKCEGMGDIYGVSLGFSSKTNKLVRIMFGDNFHYSDFEDQYIILLKKVETQKEFQESTMHNGICYEVPYKNHPVDTLVAHEIGHLFYESKSNQDRGRLVNLFSSIDNLILDIDTNHLGYPSLSSRENSLNLSINPSKSNRSVLVGHQFADFFAYIALDHRYQNNDTYFQIKRRAVEGFISNSIQNK